MNESLELRDRNGNPNPGSDEAIAQGCVCARIDNARGRGAQGTYDLPQEEKVFWTSQDCPLHGWPEKPKEPVQEDAATA